MAEGSKSVESDVFESRVANVGLQLSNFFDKERDSIDTNHNGYCDEKELKQALYSGRYRGSAARLNELLIENNKEIQSLSNDDWGVEYRGVSAKDMSKLRTPAGAEILARMKESVNADERDRSKLPNLIRAYKNSIDKDGSGDLSKGELKSYIQNSSDRPAAIKAASFVLDHFEALKGLRSSRSNGAYADVLPGEFDRNVFGEKDLVALSHVLMPQREFHKLLEAGRNMQLVSGISEILFGALVANQNKHSDFGKAVGNAHKVNGCLKSADIATDKLLFQEYKERQQMIESWKFFRQ